MPLRELNWLIFNISMRKDFHRSSTDEKWLKSFSYLDRPCLLFRWHSQSNIHLFNWSLAASFATWKKENCCLEDTRSIYMYLVNRTGSSNSISPERQERNRKRWRVKFWMMLLDCWRAESNDMNECVTYWTHSPEKCNKELDKVHDAVVLREGNLEEGKREEKL